MEPVSSDDANEKGWQCRGRQLSDQMEPDEGMADQEGEVRIRAMQEMRWMGTRAKRVMKVDMETT